MSNGPLVAVCLSQWQAVHAARTRCGLRMYKLCTCALNCKTACGWGSALASDHPRITRSEFLWLDHNLQLQGLLNLKACMLAAV